VFSRPPCSAVTSTHRHSHALQLGAVASPIICDLAGLVSHGQPHDAWPYITQASIYGVFLPCAPTTEHRQRHPSASAAAPAPITVHLYASCDYNGQGKRQQGAARVVPSLLLPNDAHFAAPHHDFSAPPCAFHGALTHRRTNSTQAMGAAPAMPPAHDSTASGLTFWSGGDPPHDVE
jgi:hypothetical protein